MEFRARIQGLGEERPVLVLLHGFPEISIMWAPLIESAIQAGVATVAFDQRGYSRDARPSNVEDHVMPELVRDVFAVPTLFTLSDFTSSATTGAPRSHGVWR